MADFDLHLTDFGELAPDGRLFCRGTAVARDGAAVLLLGPSGSGKSRLALEMMAYGAGLVADDGVWVTADLRVERPDEAPPMIEARGIGLLGVAPLREARLALVVDLGRSEPDRLPPQRQAQAPGGAVPVVLGREHPFLAPAIWQYLSGGRMDKG